MQCQKVLGRSDKKKLLVLCNTCNRDLLKEMALLRDAIDSSFFEMSTKIGECQIAKRNLKTMYLIQKGVLDVKTLIE